MDELNDEPSLIDPQLFVDQVRRDPAGSTMTYWPSYASMNPEARASYLEWLASGRTDPDAYIGYVFLFFYGLERRALVDAQVNSHAVADVGPIATEVKRLLALYSSSNSFNSYASSFLEVVYVRKGLLDDSPPDTHVQDSCGRIPLSLRIAISRKAQAGEPLPLNWAMAWMRANIGAQLRTPAHRCPDEFASLFAARYEDRYGEGLHIRPCKRRLKVAHHPASAALGGHGVTAEFDLPDVCSLTGPTSRLTELAHQCCDELDSFSRWIRKNPNGRGTMAAMALLPAPLVESSTGAGQLDDYLRSVLADREWAVVEGSGLIDVWSDESCEDLTKKDSILVAQLLQRLGHGLEPDVRFGGGPLKRNAKAVIFRCPARAPECPSTSYAAATLLLHLAVSVSAADGIVSSDEEEHLRRNVSAGLVLDAAEAARLEAHLQWLIVEPPGLAGIKRRVKALSGLQRQSMAEFLVQVAWADGRVDPDEVKTLTKIYRLLDLDPGRVHADLHALSLDPTGPATEPVIVRQRTADDSGYAVPQVPACEVEPEDSPAKLTRRRKLDMEAIQNKLQESSAVSALLAGIFVEDEPDARVAEVEAPDEDLIDGLDGPHSLLLRRLATRTSWDRGDYESLADELGVLPDGALDTLNDLAWERCDDPLCEGEDPLDINSAVLDTLLA